MTATMVVVSTVVASIVGLIGLIQKIATTSVWLSKVLSKKWKEELNKYVRYLKAVKKVLTPYGNSNCSETAITDALELLDGELKESWSNVDKWMKTNRLYKQVWSEDFIKKLNSSRTKIAETLQLFSTALKTCKYEATQHTDKTTKPTTAQPYNGNRSPVRSGSVRPPDHGGTTGGERNHGKPQLNKKSRAIESALKGPEKQRYRELLSKNVTKWTDSWDTYKNLEGPTNSTLDLAEKETLFGEHMNKLHQQYLKEYRFLLVTDITPRSSKYLTSWNDAEGHLKGHRVFDRLPERVRKAEWRNHADKIGRHKNN